MTAFLGGLTITSIRWDGIRAIGIAFDSVYTDRVVQLYGGRRLIGCTRAPSDRRVVGQLLPTLVPAPLTLLAVLPEDRAVDFGTQLPDRPWNRYALEWSAVDYPADAKWFDVLAGTAPGESPATFRVARVPFLGNTDYRFLLPPLTAGGAWEYAVVPRDGSLPEGNAGTPATVTIDAAVYPPDLTRQGDGSRFSIAVDAGDLVLGFTPGGTA